MHAFAIPEVAVIVILIALFGWRILMWIMGAALIVIGACFVGGVVYTIWGAGYSLWHGQFQSAGLYALGFVAVCVVTFMILAPLMDLDDD